MPIHDYTDDERAEMDRKGRAGANPLTDLPLEFRYGWRLEWHGWRRCLWWALMADFSIPLYGVVLFGFEVSYGKRFTYDDGTTSYTVTRSQT